jgi:hypothetical protein
MNISITECIPQLNKENKVYVDIGASNTSNIPVNVTEEGDCTVFVEASAEKAKHWTSKDNFFILNKRVEPSNIQSLLEPYIQNRDITFLTLDIDGFDYEVLEKFLEWNRPYMFCAEINEKIPPPIKFSVNYRDDYSWGGSHFFGMSISMVDILIKKYDYDIVKLDTNNIYCIRKDKNYTNISLSAEEAYDVGYKTPRLANPHFFDYNQNVDHFLTLPTNEALEAVGSFFSAEEDSNRRSLDIQHDRSSYILYLSDLNINSTLRGQINLDTPAGIFIKETCSRKDVNNIVEIGTWEGGGSTRCVLEGIQSDIESKEFWTLECSREKYQIALQGSPSLPNVHYILGKIIEDHELDFGGLETEAGTTGPLGGSEPVWIKDDRKAMAEVSNVLDRLPDNIDFLILDGGEFSSLAELKKLKDRSKIIFLDDTVPRKNKINLDDLSNDPNFKTLINDSKDRHGWAVFEKKAER